MLPSPLQCPALEYGSSFSRAAELRTPGWRRVVVSGTASILPGSHEVAHVGDVDAQTAALEGGDQFLFSFRGDTGPEHNDHGVSPTLKNCTGKARAAGFFLKQL